MQKILILLAFLSVIAIPASFAQEPPLRIDPNNVNATLNTATTATLQWQYWNFDPTVCRQQNITWNEGTGTQQNRDIALNSTSGQGKLNIFGWHIYDIKILAVCNTNSTLFGPYDVTINGITPVPAQINDAVAEPVTPTKVEPHLTDDSVKVAVESLVKMNSELINTINKLIDLL